MRRQLHTAVALLTFACGFVVSGAARVLPYGLTALLAVVLLLALSRRLWRTEYDAHRLKVLAITLLLWLAPLAFFAAMLAPPAGVWGSCMPEEEDCRYAVCEGEPAYTTAQAPVWEGYTPPCTPASSASVNASADLVWAGQMDGKALSRPEPFYPFEARAERVAGTVTVWVVVDETGLVLSAEPVAGPPLLRYEAAHAACFARFRPAVINGSPSRVSGTLTYRFAP